MPRYELKMPEKDSENESDLNSCQLFVPLIHRNKNVTRLLAVGLGYNADFLHCVNVLGSLSVANGELSLEQGGGNFS